MLSWLVLILAAVYFYRGYLNSRMDRKKLSHSSYYEVAYGGEKKCVDQAAAILKDVADTEGFCATGVIFRKTPVFGGRDPAS